MTKDEVATINGQVELIQPVQRIATRYTTKISVQEPRDAERCLRNLSVSARLLGEEGYYRWATRGKKSGMVEGPSVWLALEAMRIWGNCVLEHQPVENTDDAWVFYAMFVDLETGSTFTRPYRMSKQYNVGSGLDSARAEDVRFQIGASKAARNVILNSLPKWFINAGMVEAQAGCQEKISKYIEEHGQARAAEMILEGLQQLGVPEWAALQKCEVAAASGLSIRHLASLRGDLNALSNGAEWPDALFPAMRTAAASRRLADAAAAIPDLDEDAAGGPAAKAPPSQD